MTDALTYNPPGRDATGTPSRALTGGVVFLFFEQVSGRPPPTMELGGSMEAAVWSEPDDVHRQLADLGLTVDDCQHPVRRAQLARDFCTPNHPKGYKGMAAWGEGNAALRERLGSKPKKWTRYDAQNITRTVSPDKSMAITLLAGDKNTGDPDQTVIPQTKRPRKAASQQLVINNVQPSLPGFEEEEDPDSRAKLWYLLWHREREVARCELSLPTAVDDNGNIEAYLVRIILPNIDLSGPRPEARDDDRDPDVDVPVQRRG